MAAYTEDSEEDSGEGVAADDLFVYGTPPTRSALKLVPSRIRSTGGKSDGKRSGSSKPHRVGSTKALDPMSAVSRQGRNMVAARRESKGRRQKARQQARFFKEIDTTLEALGIGTATDPRDVVPTGGGGGGSSISGLPPSPLSSSLSLSFALSSEAQLAALATPSALSSRAGTPPLPPPPPPVAAAAATTASAAAVADVGCGAWASGRLNPRVTSDLSLKSYDVPRGCSLTPERHQPNPTTAANVASMTMTGAMGPMGMGMGQPSGLAPAPGVVAAAATAAATTAAAATAVRPIAQDTPGGVSSGSSGATKGTAATRPPRSPQTPLGPMAPGPAPGPAPAAAAPLGMPGDVTASMAIPSHPQPAPLDRRRTLPYTAVAAAASPATHRAGAQRQSHRRSASYEGEMTTAVAVGAAAAAAPAGPLPYHPTPVRGDWAVVLMSPPPMSSMGVIGGCGGVAAAAGAFCTAAAVSTGLPPSTSAGSRSYGTLADRGAFRRQLGSVLVGHGLSWEELEAQLEESEERGQALEEEIETLLEAAAGMEAERRAGRDCGRVSQFPWMDLLDHVASLDEMYRKVKDVLRKAKPLRSQVAEDRELLPRLHDLSLRLLGGLAEAGEALGGAAVCGLRSLGEWKRAGGGGSVCGGSGSGGSGIGGGTTWPAARLSCEEEVRVGGRTVRRLLDALDHVAKKISDDLGGTNSAEARGMLHRCQEVSLELARAIMHAAEAAAPELLMRGSLAPHTFAHEKSSQAKRLVALWEEAARQTDRIAKRYTRQRLSLYSELCDVYEKAGQLALEMTRGSWAPGTTRRTEDGATRDEGMAEDATSGDDGVSCSSGFDSDGGGGGGGGTAAWGGGAAGAWGGGGLVRGTRKRRGGASAPEVQSQAWVPSLLQVLLNRASDAHRNLRNELSMADRVGAAGTGAGDGGDETNAAIATAAAAAAELLLNSAGASVSGSLTGTAPSCDLQLSDEQLDDMWDLLDEMQQTFAELCLANLTRTTWLCAGGSGPLPLWALESVRDAAEAALRFIHTHEHSSMALGDMLDMLEELGEETRHWLHSTWNDYTTLTRRVVDGLLSVRRQINVRRNVGAGPVLGPGPSRPLTAGWSAAGAPVSRGGGGHAGTARTVGGGNGGGGGSTRHGTRDGYGRGRPLVDGPPGWRQGGARAPGAASALPLASGRQRAPPPALPYEHRLPPPSKPLQPQLQQLQPQRLDGGVPGGWGGSELGVSPGTTSQLDPEPTTKPWPNGAMANDGDTAGGHATAISAAGPGDGIGTAAVPVASGTTTVVAAATADTPGSDAAVAAATSGDRISWKAALLTTPQPSRDVASAAAATADRPSLTGRTSIDGAGPGRPALAPVAATAAAAGSTAASSRDSLMHASSSSSRLSSTPCPNSGMQRRVAAAVAARSAAGGRAGRGHGRPYGRSRSRRREAAEPDAVTELPPPRPPPPPPPLPLPYGSQEELPEGLDDPWPRLRSRVAVDVAGNFDDCAAASDATSAAPSGAGPAAETASAAAATAPTAGAAATAPALQRPASPIVPRATSPRSPPQVQPPPLVAALSWASIARGCTGGTAPIPVPVAAAAAAGPRPSTGGGSATSPPARTVVLRSPFEVGTGAQKAAVAAATTATAAAAATAATAAGPSTAARVGGFISSPFKALALQQQPSTSSPHRSPHPSAPPSPVVCPAGGCGGRGAAGSRAGGAPGVGGGDALTGGLGFGDVSDHKQHQQQHQRNEHQDQLHPASHSAPLSASNPDPHGTNAGGGSGGGNSSSTNGNGGSGASSFQFATGAAAAGQPSGSAAVVASACNCADGGTGNGKVTPRLGSPAASASATAGTVPSQPNGHHAANGIHQNHLHQNHQLKQQHQSGTAATATTAAAAAHHQGSPPREGVATSNSAAGPVAGAAAGPNAAIPEAMYGSTAAGASASRAGGGSSGAMQNARSLSLGVDGLPPPPQLQGYDSLGGGRGGGDGGGGAPDESSRLLADPEVAELFRSIAKDPFWYIRWRDLSHGLTHGLSNMVGSGSIGQVFAGMYLHGEVAIKVIGINREMKYDLRALRAVKHEVDLNKRLNQHPNIVRFIGVCAEYIQHAARQAGLLPDPLTDGDGGLLLDGAPANLGGQNNTASGTSTSGTTSTGAGTGTGTGTGIGPTGLASNQPMLAIVMEYCPMGTLYNMIGEAQQASRGHRRRGHGTDFLRRWERRLEVLWGAAAGLEYMHRCKVIHHDFTSYNLLLEEKDGRWITKVCDFNLSRVIAHSGGLGARALTVPNSGSFCSPRWQSPEYLAGQDYGWATDVFSFAVVIWEVVTLQRPWENELQDARYEPMAMHRMYSEGKRLSFPQHEDIRPALPELPQLVALCQDCWREDPRERPGMSEVAEKLMKLLEGVQRRERAAAVAARAAAVLGHPAPAPTPPAQPQPLQPQLPPPTAAAAAAVAVATSATCAAATAAAVARVAATSDTAAATPPFTSAAASQEPGNPPTATASLRGPVLGQVQQSTSGLIPLRADRELDLVHRAMTATATATAITAPMPNPTVPQGTAATAAVATAATATVTVAAAPGGGGIPPSPPPEVPPPPLPSAAAVSPSPGPTRARNLAPLSPFAAAAQPRARTRSPSPSPSPSPRGGATSSGTTSPR